MPEKVPAGERRRFRPDGVKALDRAAVPSEDDQQRAWALWRASARPGARGMIDATPIDPPNLGPPPVPRG